HLGFARAARNCPLHASDDEVRPLYRQALYALILPGGDKNWKSKGPGGHDLRELVLERFLAALDRHWGDDYDRYDNWLSGPNSNFELQIAQQKGARGGPLDRQIVRRVLQDLGWEAYPYVAGCLEAIMHVFHRLLPEPLTASEMRRFERMHFKQPYFGDLPFILFAQRFPFLDSILAQIWEEGPDPGNLGVLYRLLAYYGEMAVKRRETDRIMKARRAPGGGGYRLECPMHAEMAPREQAVADQGAEADLAAPDDPPPEFV